MKSRIGIIGAGAAGCLCAIELKRRRPDAAVTILEAADKALKKLAVTGGGRCNLTNSFAAVSDVRQAYPHGAVLMKRLLNEFNNNDILDWFRAEGVEFTLQEDNCWFPKSQDAMALVETLLRLCRENGVELNCGAAVKDIEALGDEAGFRVRYEKNGVRLQEQFDILLVCAGGGVHHFMDSLGLEKVPCVPSLFSLNIKNEALNALMGTVIERVRLSIAGEKICSEGTLLLSHWGVSGPVTLNLSAFAARLLAAKAYRDVQLKVNWLCATENEVRDVLNGLGKNAGSRMVRNSGPECLPARLWEYLLQRSGLTEGIKWQDLGKQAFNRLVNTLTNDTYAVEGKCKFQPGFVTSGGIALNEINYSTMECKKFPGLYLAGEILDIDAITGGFNLQAAWTTGWIVAKAISQPD